LAIQLLKSFQLQGAPGPRWGLRPQTPGLGLPICLGWNKILAADGQWPTCRHVVNWQVDVCQCHFAGLRSEDLYRSNALTQKQWNRSI